MNDTRIFILVALFTFFIASCGSSTAQPKPQTASGSHIFKIHCVTCHGINGKLQLNGAKDLGTSTLTLDERIILVTNGRNLMTPFKNVLSQKEIEAVAEYSMTFSQ